MSAQPTTLCPQWGLSLFLGSPVFPLFLLSAPTSPFCVTTEAHVWSVYSVPGTALGISGALTRLPFPVLTCVGQ